LSFRIHWFKTTTESIVLQKCYGPAAARDGRPDCANAIGITFKTNTFKKSNQNSPNANATPSPGNQNNPAPAQTPPAKQPVTGSGGTK